MNAQESQMPGHVTDWEKDWAAYRDMHGCKLVRIDTTERGKESWKCANGVEIVRREPHPDDTLLGFVISMLQESHTDGYVRNRGKDWAAYRDAHHCKLVRIDTTKRGKETWKCADGVEVFRREPHPDDTSFGLSLIHI